jgi:hypothetical protein
MSATRPTSAHTLGAELERERLEHRLGRVTVAIAALRLRASEHRRELGEPPTHIRQAIADFEAQPAAMYARLRDLAHDRGSPESTDGAAQMSTVTRSDSHSFEEVRRWKARFPPRLMWT